MSRRIWIGVSVGVLVVVIIVVAVVLSVTLGGKVFKSTFMKNCEKHNGAKCQELWEAFSQAYVEKNPCNVPMEAYDPLIQKAPIEPMYNRALFWSKTEDFLRVYKENTKGLTLEDTLLGSLVKNEIWFGKEGSKKTFIGSGCKAWDDCENNPRRSFWDRASAAFAEAARDDVTALLNGDIGDPFSPTSTFRRIEIKRLKYPRVKSMKVVLVTKNPGTNCLKPFLEDLKKELDNRINYSCGEVSNGHKCFASVLVYLLLMGQFFL